LVKLFTNQPLDDEWAFEELKRLQDSDIEALRIIPRESDDNAGSMTSGNVKECPYTTAEGTELCWRCQPHHCVTHRMDTAQQRSPAKCFADQEKLEKVIRRLIEYRGHVSDSMIADECKFRERGASNFQAGVTAVLIQSFVPPTSSAVIYDPCGGWGGRLLGSFRSGVVRRYIATEPSIQTFNGLRRLALIVERYARRTGQSAPEFDLRRSGCEDVDIEDGTVDLVLTSPPYYNVEMYPTMEEDKADQSAVKYKTPHAWQTEFLPRMMRRVAACLRSGAPALINITDNKQLPWLEQKTQDAAINAGLTLERVHRMAGPTPRQEFESGLAMQPHQKALSLDRAVGREKLFVFRKPP